MGPGHLTSWGLPEMNSSATETKAMELFNGHCFGAQKEGGQRGSLYSHSLLTSLQVLGTFKSLIHLFVPLPFPDKFLRSL